MEINRRTAVQLSLTAVATTMTRTGRAAEGPIRIGLITTLSGAPSISGVGHRIGAEIAVKEINDAGGLLGRPLELSVRDDQSNPNTAVAAVREFAGDGTRIFIGVLASPVALAISGIMKELDGVFLNAASHGNNLTHEDFNRNYFRMTDYSRMRISAASFLMAKKYPGVQTWGAILPDAEIGRSTIKTFNYAMPKYYRALDAKELKFRDPVWVKFGATDYRNAIATLISADIDGLFVGIAAGDEIAFLQQAGQLGLTQRLKVIVNSGSDLQVGKALGRRTPENYWSGDHWYYGAYLGNPISDQLYAAYVARTGDKFPDGYVAATHTAIRGVAAAAKAVGSMATAKLIEGFEDLTFDSAKGPVHIRKEDHQAIMDVNYVNVAPASGPEGWSVREFFKVSGEDFAGAPTPGAKTQFE